MSDSFNSSDRSRWYFGVLSRDEADEIFNKRAVEAGTFLVRDSARMLGDFALCVREKNNRVKHYIINRVTATDGSVRFKIGDMEFPDIASLLDFYKTHCLDTTPLVRPVAKQELTVIAKFDYLGHDDDDLSFNQGEILTVLEKDEENWWTARNREGRQGSIPVPYVEERIEEKQIASAPEEQDRFHGHRIAYV